MGHKVCKWGVKCKSRHLENDVQGYEHKYNKHRRHNHYSHHRHGDGLYDRSYDRSNDRHQNKREAHDPYRLKNRDIGNKQVYNTYNVTETTQIVIRIPRWVLLMRNTTKAHRDIRVPL